MKIYYVIYTLLLLGGVQDLCAHAARGFSQAASQSFKRAKRSYQRGVNFARNSKDSVKNTVLAMHTWGQRKIENTKYRWKVYREVYEGTRDFIKREKEKIMGFIPGLLIGSFATYRFQDSLYSEQLKKDMEEAVDKGNLHKLAFMDKSTKATFKESIDYAVKHDRKAVLKALFDERDDFKPKSDKNDYLLKDRKLRLVVAAKLNDTDYVAGLIQKYPKDITIDDAIDVARKVKNKPLLANLLREKGGYKSSSDTMLAVAALEDIGIVEFLSVGRQAFKDMVGRWLTFSSVGEAPDPDMFDNVWQ